MLKQFQSQHLAIRKLKLEFLAVESRVILMDDAMVIRTDDNDICGVVVLRRGEIVDMVGCEQRHTDTGMVIPSFSNDLSTVFCNMNPLT